LIHSLGVNAPHSDQWDDIQIIGASFSGHLSMSQLWAQHNESRIFFPNLIVLLLSRTSHFNIVLEEYLGAFLLIVSIGLVALAHRRRVGQAEWLLYCPVAFFMLSFVQHQNMLWGFQLAWYLVLATVVFAFFLLDRVTLSWPALSVAIASGIVASFSSLQGLIV
jgi:hypothetical protein